MSENLLTIEKILARLADHPRAIGELTAGLAIVQLHAAPAPGEWSANEVLAHLRSCSDMWGGTIARILAQDTPSIRAISPRTWIKKTDYLKQEFTSSFQIYARQRVDLLTMLESLAPEGWSRKAIVKGVGKEIERTVQDYAERLAIHERSHVTQIARIAGSMRQE
jgi:hypothetical protein